MLVRGERDAVVRYLKGIARTFPRGAGAVDEWLVLIRAGRKPILEWPPGVYRIADDIAAFPRRVGG